MKITPLEIRQKSFEKNFRGYDKDEVDAFLLSMSQEWERVIDENKDLRIRLQTSEKEVQKLREVESTLFRTLKTAEDTGTNIVEQANKTAELLMREAQMNAEGILSDARSKAKILIEEADEKGKNVLYDVDNKYKNLSIEIQQIENQRQNLLMELKNIANDTLERVSRLDATKKVWTPSPVLELTSVENIEKQPQKKPAIQPPINEEVPSLKSESKHPTSELPVKTIYPDPVSPGSFFDQI